MVLARVAKRGAVVAARGTRVAPRRQQMQQRRTLKKNAFLEEWDASKTDKHKTFSISRDNIGQILLLAVVFPAMIFVPTLKEEDLRTGRNYKERYPYVPEE